MTLEVFSIAKVQRVDPLNTLDVLVVAPHPDDAELGMGGSILKLKQEGLRIGVLDLTSGEPTPHGSEEIRQEETKHASGLLQLALRENLGLPNRSLEANLESRHRLAGFIRQTRPRWLFAPYWVDAHPDHVAAAELVEAARFWAKLTKTDLPGEPWHPERIFYYFSIHLKLVPQPAFVVDISQHWSQKLQAIKCYQSQFAMGPRGDSPMFFHQLESEASYWGKSIGTAYGEPFASREPVGLTGFGTLI